MVADRKTALVLGGGGMFGAYEAGVWRALAPHWKPDLVVGASIGAVNGWVIAGGCDPEELAGLWQHLEMAGRRKLRFPWPLLDGVVDGREFEAFLKAIHARYTPRTEFALTATRLRGLRPCVFRTPEITWRHLAASCAVPVLLKQYEIGGVRYSDGGLKGAVPVWAAAECGATHIVAVNILPRNTWLRPVQALLRVAGTRQRQAPSPPCLLIEHAGPLGPLADSFRWQREKIERWIDWGRQDTEAALEQIMRLLAA